MNDRKFKILIVEDDVYYNQVLTKYVQSLCNESNFPGVNFDIRSYRSAKECLDRLDDDIEIIVMDYYLDANDDFPYNGFDLLKKINKHCKHCKVIVVSGQHNVTITTELFKQGVYDYVDKNYMPAKRLSIAIRNILNMGQGGGVHA